MTETYQSLAHSRWDCKYQCAVKGKSTQPVKVRPKEVSVHLGSYPGDGRVTGPSKLRGQRLASRAGQQACGPQRE